ncbi:Methyl viologen resistance protein SmvA [Serratia fonticola]|uniref:Methyl viologen resistance protein SmvA n=1 Tax=Serratia fonticola TaxID=47917 RepID=A0A4U9U8Q1_SERFO|nr:Methyl viologen resistance protein SmvA [Serratia fonticola]
MLSQRLQLVLGMTPLLAALFILPIPVASALAGPLAGALLPRYGERYMLVGGFILTALGIAGVALWYQGNVIMQLVCLFVVGFGLGGAITAASNGHYAQRPRRQGGHGRRY